MSTSEMTSANGGAMWSFRTALLYTRNLPSSIWALALTTLLLAIAYAPNFSDLYSTWDADPNYSHGKLVIPIALFILWRRLSETRADRRTTAEPTRSLGWILLIAVLAIRAIAYEQNSQWVETATLLPAIICITWTFGGWPLLSRVWPAIAFLLFLFPLPGAVNGLMAIPLQSLAAVGSCFVLQLLGFWAIREGNVISLGTPRGSVPLDIALACNGLRMLMTMTATIVATIILIPMPTWKRVTLLFSTIPIALLSNILRIVATGWSYYALTDPAQKMRAHDWSGFLMMPLALVLVALELQLLSWLVPDKNEQDVEDQKFVVPLINAKPTGKKPRQNADLDELA
jgi:exosortase